MTHPMVVTEIENEIAWITMDDGKANALSLEMIGALAEALDASKEAKAVVFCGRPGRFSAGFDLKTMMAGPEKARTLVKAGAELLMRIYGLAQPVIAACSGHAIAGGALLLMACDQRIGVSGEFKIGLNETSIGVILPKFGIALANDRLDRRLLSQATLQATIYSPEGACEVGFLDRAVDADVFKAAVQEDALRLAGLNPAAYAGLKRDQRSATIARVLDELDGNLDQIIQR